ncbi:unnamed protein product [Ceratitis capitata]|uniref:(Mediterranean fruit fly) hypothetical protein n=1 Tax=Ceratitis capitata TaxID=7213 RepID=A0A811VE02_CERCA|nr:unnamed protein product [Ceratitis capitata]
MLALRNLALIHSSASPKQERQRMALASASCTDEPGKRQQLLLMSAGAPCYMQQFGHELPCSFARIPSICLPSQQTTGQYWEIDPGKEEEKDVDNCQHFTKWVRSKG